MRKRFLAIFLAFTMTINSSEMILAAESEGIQWVPSQEQEINSEESAGEIDINSGQTETKEEEITEQPALEEQEPEGEKQETGEMQEPEEVEQETGEMQEPEEEQESGEKLVVGEGQEPEKKQEPEEEQELEEKQELEEEQKQEEVLTEQPPQETAEEVPGLESENTVVKNAMESYMEASPTEEQEDNSEFIFSGGVITGYRGSESTVIIPDEINGVPVTSIARNAFADNQNLESIVIGKNVKSIYPEAFTRCKNLKTVRFLGTQVPMGYGGHSLQRVSNLESIYVPVEAYAAYHNTFLSCLKNGARMYTNTGEEFIVDEDVLVGYTGDGEEVILPENLIGIGSAAFCGNKTVKRVYLQDGITEIGENAFYNCQNLESIENYSQIEKINAYSFYNCKKLNICVSDMENLKEIGISAFQMCSNLTGDLILPSGLKSISASAFSRCTGFSGKLILSEGIETIGENAFLYGGFTGDLRIPDSVQSIEASAFSGCSGFNGNLFLPSDLRSISASAFYDCSGLQGDLNIPEGVETIGDSAFYSCTGFDGVLNFPSALKSIGSYAFQNCSSLSGTLILPESLTSMGNCAFSGCSGFQGDLNIPESLENIGESMFKGCTGFDGALNLPSALKSIGSYAFQDCSSLSGTLVLPESLTSIGTSAFSGCSGFSGCLEIPNVTRWGGGAFQKCIGITSVIFDENAAFNKEGIFYLCSKIKKITLYCEPAVNRAYDLLSYMESLDSVYVPSELYGAYMDAWKNNIPENVSLKSLEDEEFIVSDGVLFGYTGDAAEITLPEEISQIGNYAFKNNQTVEKIIFPSGVKKIGAYAFENSSIKEIVNPSELEEIGDGAFRNCQNLTSLLMTGESLKKIGREAFYNCSALSGKISVSSGLKEIGAYTFYGCIQAESFLLPESIETIGEAAFAECTSLKKINIPEGIVAIPREMLSRCGTLEGLLEIPENVISIGDSAFKSCYGLTGLELPQNLQSIGAEAFYGCSGLEGSLKLPEKLTSIGAGSFYACRNITGEVILPDQIEELPYSVFAGTGIESLILGKNLKSIGRNVLTNCSNLKTITFCSQEPPGFAYVWEVFNEPENLETIYVPQGTYSRYLTVIGNYMPAGVRVLEEGAGDFITSGTVLISYNGKDNEIEIPSNITEIGDNAFRRNTNLEKVTFCDGIIKIGSYAFAGCSNLKEIINTDDLESIGTYSFSGCDSLSGNILKSHALHTIGSYAFAECNSLGGDTGELLMNDSLISIGSSAFEHCYGFTSVVIPDGITTIESLTFSECYDLESVKFPGSIENIGYRAFSSTGIKGLELPDGLKIIGEEAFAHCNHLSGDIRIPDTVESLSNNVFFRYNGKIGELILGTGIKTVQAYSINAANFNSIRFLSTEPPVFENNAIKNLGSDIIVYVPYEAYKKYYDTFCDQGFAGRLMADSGEEFYIENNILISYFGNNQDVVIPENITEIGPNAFRNNYEVENVILSEGISVIGDGAFANCRSLKTVENTEGLIKIGNSSFANCEKLEAFDLSGKNLERIGDGAFSNCSLLKLPEISDTVNYIGDSAFRYCSSMNGSIKLPENLTTIGSYAFYRCDDLKGNLVIPDKVTYIGGWAFRECGFEGSLKLPEGLETIGGYTFYGTKFTGVLHLPEKLTGLGNGTFSGCQFTGELILPESMKYLSDTSLQGLNIDSLVVGNQMENIGPDALSGCQNLKKLVFLCETPPSAENPRFLSALVNLEEIYVPEQSLELYERTYRSRVGDEILISSDFASIPVSNLQADKIYSGSVHLTWNPSVSGDTSGYIIYRDDQKEPVGRTESTEFTDRNLTTARTYTYRVRTITESGEEGYASQIEVTPILPQVISIGTDNFLNKIGIGNSRIYAYVKNLKNLEPLGEETTVGRFYYEDIFGKRIPIGEPVSEPYSLTETQGVYTIEWDIKDIPPASYKVIFELTDIDGGSAETGGEILVDNSVPDKITGLTAIGDTNQIVLSWTMAHELDTERYHVYKKEQEQSEFRLYKRIIGRENLTYTDLNVQPGKKYNYYVVGVNDFGQEGEASDVATATPASDTEKPRVVKITPVNGSVLSQTTEIYVQSQDNVSVTKTEIHLSADNGDTWELLGSTETDNCRVSLDTAKYNDQTLLVKGTAYDAAGNVSDSMQAEYQVDNTGPEQVTGLSAESTSTTITLHWKDVQDRDFYFFRVEERKAGEENYEQCQDVYTTLGANLLDLIPDTEYFYRVVAYDRYGNRGAPSEEIAVTTQKDVNPPVITSITPQPGYYRDEIPLSIRTQDDAEVEKVIIQVSSNGVLWTDVEEITVEGYNPQIQYDLNLENLEEGLLYVRGISQDSSGNISDRSSSAPFVQYYVDRTPPAEPENVQVQGYDGYIEITWDMGTEQDLADYILYRSEDGKKFEEYDAGLYQTNYIDRKTEEDQTYWYQIAVRDYAGNISQRTKAIQGVVLQDTQPPQIQSAAPVSGTVLGQGRKRFSVLASDNRKLKSMSVYYGVNSKENLQKLDAKENIENYYYVLETELPLDSLEDGDKLYIKATAEDISGMKTESEIYEYTIDKVAPSLENVQVSGDEEKITVQWVGFQEEDLQGYQIYRKPAGGSYTIVGQKLKEDNQGKYIFHDYTGEVKETYSYKVEAVDTAGNTYSLLSENVWLTAVMKLEAGLLCDTWQSVDTEYVFDASSTVSEAGIADFEMDFGDGQEPVVQTDPKFIHRYSAAGNYKVTLTVTDKMGSRDSYTKEVQVKEPELLGTVRVHVEDVDGQNLSGMPVYFDLDNTSDNVRYTDGRGNIEFASQVGKFSVGAYDTNYLPVKKDIVVRSNTDTEITLTMVKAPIVTGKFEVDRMTLDEIQAAGIDIADPANQQVMKFTIHLTYTERGKVIEDTFEIAMNDKNETWELVSPNIPDRHFITKPLIVDLGDNGGHYEGSSSGPAIVAVLDIPAEASFLKEFFDVRLHIINQAGSEFTLSGNQVHLNVPQGMSIVDALDHSSSADVTFNDLKGQEQATVSWVLRGDEQGEYDLSADYQGVLEQFNKTVNATFTTDEPIKVYGTSAVKLIAEINSKILYNALYFNLGIMNKSDIDIYMPSINIDDETITSYKEKKEGSGNWEEDMEIPVKQLASSLMNQEGFSQNIDMEEPVEVLASGETLINKYAVYGATDYQDIAYLQEAVYEIAEEMDVEVEIRTVDMELYNIENAEEKVADIRQDKNKTAFVEEMIDVGNDNYYYVRQAIQGDDDLAQNLSEGAYKTLDFVFNFDFSLFTNDDIDKVTREYIRDLLLDEGTTENVERIVENTEMKVLKSTVDAFGIALGATGESGAEAVASALNDVNTFNKLKNDYDSQGQEGLKKGIKNLIINMGFGTGEGLLLKEVDNFDFSGTFRSSMKTTCGNISTVLGILDDYNTAWSESQEFCDIMMAVNANYEEAEFLLRTMALNIGKIKSFDSRNTVENTLNDMIAEMDTAMDQQMQVFVQEFVELEAGRLGSAAMKEIAVMVFGKQGGIMYNLCKAAFNLLDTSIGWGESVKDIQKVRIAAILSACMKQGVREMWKNPEGQEEDFLRGLKYLFKLRMMGERDYTVVADESIDKEKVVNMINNEQGTNYENAYDYYLDMEVWLLEQRDAIYGNKSQVLNIPAAPEVSLDYVRSCTEQSFDSSYEYAIGGEKWTECTQGPIYVTAKDVNQTLWVRVKGTAEHMSGNVTKITIPAMEPLLGDIKAFYDGAKYHVTGLSAGTYSYMFSEQEELEEEWNPQKQFVFSGEEIVFQADGEHNYIHLRKEASNGSSEDKRGAGFHSLIKTIASLGIRNIQVDYDDTMGTVTGQGEYMEQSQVLLEAIPKDGYVFLGWYEGGYMISDKPQLSFTVTENRTLQAEFAQEGVESGIVVVSCNPENTGILQGGGVYPLGESVTIRAQAVPGYNFTGWYDEQGNCITTSRTYEFILDNPEVHYLAGYQFLGKAEVTIYSESDRGFLVNGEKKESGYTAPWPKGTEVTLQADNSDGTFAYWTDREGICLSNTPVYTFQVSNITEYYAIYKNDKIDTTEVIFLSDYGQVIERKDYNKGEEVSMPVGPSRLGYEFVSWNKTAEEIKELINTGETMVVILPVYEKTELKFGLTLTNGSIIYQENPPDQDGRYTYGTKLQIQREEPEEGWIFSHWEDEKGNILSYRDTYLFMLNKDMDIRGVYVQDGTAPEKKAAIVISGSRAYIEDHVIKVSFSATRDVPDDFSVISNGIIVTDDSSVGQSEEVFILGGKNVKTGNSSNKTNKGVHTLTIRNAGKDVIWYARGYLIFQDQEGNQYTVYSDIAEEKYTEQ